MVLFLATHGRADASAYEALRSFQQSDGGFCTYNDFTNSATHRSSTDVSAVALRALLTELPPDVKAIESCVIYLMRMLEDGNWGSYWYESADYVALHACRALRVLDLMTPETCRAIEAARRPVSAHDPFQLASRLLLPPQLSQRSKRDECLSQLLDLQSVDGGWFARSPVMRPDPWNHASSSSSAGIFDHAALFTTATAAEALARVLEDKYNRG